MHGVAAASYSSPVRCVQQGAGEPPQSGSAGGGALCLGVGPIPPMNTCGKAAENELWVALFLSWAVVGVLDATRRRLPA